MYSNRQTLQLRVPRAHYTSRHKLPVFPISLLLWLVIACPTARAQSPDTVLVLGDSISAAYGIQREEGWVALLQNRLDGYATGAQVINASISGETTGGGRARLPDALAEHEPEIVVIELGGNDGLRGYPTERMRENLEEMVQTVIDQERQVLLVEMQIPPNYGPRYTNAFRNVFQQVADAFEVPLVPFFLQDVALEPGMMQSDGIHPTAQAQGLLLDAIWPYLAPLLGLSDAN